MARNPTIPEIAAELSNWILDTKRKQRRLRSGSFWQKFGIHRRTPEKIAAVKKALSDEGISLGLDEGRFGHEDRSDLIILNCLISSGSTEPEPLNLKSAKFSKEKIEFQASESLEIPFNDAEIAAGLKHISKIMQFPVGGGILFSLLFRLLFSNETPNYLMSPGVFGASRSNWTYHTATAISNASKLLSLNCKFETGGKRDAIIETKGEDPEVILVAEWEWDYADVFGAGKEIEKLKVSCNQFVTADAFLFTYCPNSMFIDYVRKISEAWIIDPTDSELQPTLFLHVLVFSLSGRDREFTRLKTLAIHPSSIDLWEDIVF
jgi:hypothetical protein